jgi:hypothetical protein
MDKGKGKLLEDEESDQEFNPEEPQDLDQESDEADEEYESEDEDEEEDEDELQDLLEEAQEYGDGGDMVDGLRSGKYRNKLVDSSLASVSHSKGQSWSGGGSSGTTGKRPAQESLENNKKK